METDAVYTMTEKNDERNVNFLQNMWCVEKVTRLKPYFSRQKRTMNEISIFFQNTSYVQIESKLKLYLPRQKRTMNETLIFFQVVSIGIRHIYSSEFFICQSTSDFFFIQWEAVFTQTEINNRCNVNFLQNRFHGHSTRLYQRVFDCSKHL